MRKALSFLSRLFGTAVAIVALLALALAISPLLASRAPGRPAFIGPYAPMIVLGGSMEPTYRLGSILFIERVRPEDVRAGDVITFDSAGFDGGRPASLTTHRVTAIERTDAQLMFRTKGDANTTEDPTPVPASALAGRGVLAIPYVGFASAFVRSRTGFLLLVVLPAMVMIILEGRTILRSLGSRRVRTAARRMNADPARRAAR